MSETPKSVRVWAPSTPGEIPRGVHPRRKSTGEVYYPPPPWQTSGVWPHATAWEWGEWEWWLACQGWGPGARAWYRGAREVYGVGVTVEGVQRWGYQPTPVQVALHTAPQKYVLFGGAVGGTKSHGLRWDFIWRGFRTPDYRGLIWRRTMPELRDNHIEKVGAEMAALGFGGLGVDSDGYLRLPSLVAGAPESVLRFGHCQNLGDELKYLGTEYDWFGPDEAVTFYTKQITGAMGRMRTSKAGVMSVMRTGTNPGGVDPRWWIEHFLEKSVDRRVEKRYDPARYGYVPAQLYDNPFLMDPDGTFTEYITSLDVSEPVRLQQLLEGDWTVSVGQYFTEWRVREHVVAPPVGVSKDVVRIAGLDWGYLKPGVWLLLLITPDGKIVVEDELVFRETLADEAAKQIKQRLNGRKVRLTAADPAMWIRDGQTGQSIAETFARAGVPLIRANHERINGWQRVRAWLRPAPDGGPWLTVSTACPYLIRTFPAMVVDSVRHEDLDSDGEDHGVDALRYSLMSRPTPGAQRKPEPPTGTVGAWMRELQRPERGAIV